MEVLFLINESEFVPTAGEELSVLRYVRLDDISAYLDLGWGGIIPLPAPDGAHAVAMQWYGEGEPRTP
jgi:hypothetical protein